MDDIVIKVQANSDGIQDLNKQLETLRVQNKKLEDQVTSSHNKSKQQHGESVDLNTKLLHSFKELGEGIVAAFAVEKLVEWGEEAVKAYAEATEATNKLKFAVTEANGEGVESFKKLSEQSEKLSSHLNNLFTAKQIQGIQTQLANYGLMSKEIEKLTPQILDISAATGKSLEEVTNKFVSAINGQTKGLKDIGVAFKDTGSKTENFNKVLEQTAKFGGSAEEKMHTLSGILEEIKNQKEVFLEGLGKGLIDAGHDAITVVKSLVQIAHELFDSSEDLRKAEENSKRIEQLNAENEARVNKSELKKKLNKDDLEETIKFNKEIQEVNKKSGAFIISKEQIAERRDALEKIQEDFEKINEKIKNGVQSRNGYILTNEEQLVFDSVNSQKLGLDKRLALLSDEYARRKKLEDDATLKGDEAALKAAERLKAIWEKYYTELAAIIKKDLDDNKKLTIDAIEDKTLKAIAKENESYRQQQLALQDNESKLNEIIKAGINSQDAERRNTALKAKAELDNLHKDQQLSEEAHQVIMTKILKDAEAEDEAARLEGNKKEAQARAELSDQDFKNGQIEAKRALVNGKITQEDYNKQIKELEIASLEERLAIEQSYGIEDVKLQQEIEEKKLDLQAETSKKSKENTKETIEEIKQITETVLQSLSTAVETNITIIDTQMEKQNRMIDEQKILAEKGLQNDLAFEEKRADDLTKKKIAEEKKLKNIKEFETFLNSVAKFSEDDPKTAIPKALGILAATKAAEAVFAEEGGIIGQIGSRSIIGSGMSRKHKSGNDVLLHAEKGEGILSVNEMGNLGANNFNMLKSMLKTPFNEKLIPAKNNIIMQDNSAMLERLESLEQTIKNKKEVNIDIDSFGTWVTTEIENGVKKITKNYNPNPKRRI